MKTIRNLILVTHTTTMTPIEIEILLSYLKTDEGRNDLSPEFNYTQEELLRKAKKKMKKPLEVTTVRTIDFEDVIRAAGDNIGRRLDISDFFLKTKYEWKGCKIVEGKIELIHWMEKRIDCSANLFRFGYLDSVKVVVEELKNVPDDVWVMM